MVSPHRTAVPANRTAVPAHQSAVLAHNIVIPANTRLWTSPRRPPGRLRRPKTPPRRPKMPPRRPQDAPRHAQDALRRPWDASKTHPRAAPDAQNIPRRLKTLPNPPRSPLDLDFGASRLGFRSFVGTCLIYLHGFGMICSTKSKPKNTTQTVKSRVKVI